MKQYTAYFQAAKVSKNSIFLIDLDGTLVDTNYANCLAYIYGVKKILGYELCYNKKERFTRETLNEIFPNIQKSIFEEIVRTKECKYKEYLEKTEVNRELLVLLQKYYKTNTMILVTKCSEKRAVETLSYHNLIHYFSNKIFSKGSNKYKETINTLGLSVASLIIFEDEDTEIKNAINAGIPIQNINKVIF